MDLERLKKQLIADEGCKFEIYLDTKGLPTFGIGHLLTKDDIEWDTYKRLSKNGKLTVSQQRIDQVFKQDIEIVVKSCCTLFKGFNSFAEDLQQIIANMMFNIGLPKFSKFVKFIKAIGDKNYAKAAQEMIDSNWYRELDKLGSKRAARLVAEMNCL